MKFAAHLVLDLVVKPLIAFKVTGAVMHALEKRRQYKIHTTPAV